MNRSACGFPWLEGLIMRYSLDVKCYLCSLDVKSYDCMGVSGLGPMKYVCPVCTKTVVFAVVMDKHDDKNAANRRYLAKRAPGSGQE